jgi:hypothetical protein
MVFEQQGFHARRARFLERLDMVDHARHHRRAAVAVHVDRTDQQRIDALGEFAIARHTGAALRHDLPVRLVLVAKGGSYEWRTFR